MSKPQIIEHDQFFSVESGVYSDYRVHGFAQAIADINLSEKLAEFLGEHYAGQKSAGQCDCVGDCLDLFIPWLAKHGLASNLQYETFDVDREAS